jgi:hypothetical protein
VEVVMRRLLIPFLGVAVWLAACGSSSDSGFFEGSSSDGASSSGAPGPFGSSNGDPNGTSGTDPATNRLKIDPLTATVNATGAIGALVGTTTFHALLDNSPTPVAAKWSVDDAGIGTIDQNGVFSAGLFAGKTTVRAQVGSLQATAEVIVNIKIEEDLTPAPGLSDADKTKLRAGGTADASFKWLYPYDRTVFPRGLPAPRLQFTSAAPRAFYVKVKSNQLEYEGFYPGGSGASRVTVAEAVWKLVTQSAKANDPVTVSVTKVVGANSVTGPSSETWNIAQGSLKGTVFYNSYNSALAGAIGAVLRVKPGTTAEVFIRKTRTGGTSDKYCIVCHSVSAQGNRLVSGVSWGNDPAEPGQTNNDGNPQDSASFRISTTGTATQEYYKDDGRILPFGALTPDAKYLLGSAVSPSGPNIRGLQGTFASKLYDAANGAVINDTFFGGANTRYAVTPAFSHDGKRVAFTDKNANAEGRRLSILSVDTAGATPVFSGLAQLAVSPNKVVAWPTFTPDGKGVIYHEGDHFDTGAHSAGDTLGRREANLKWVDVATKKVASLDALNGVRNGALYLPYDANVEKNLNYEPTTLPVAVGGYTWVVFTSRRSFGNTIYDGPNSLRAVGDKPFDNGDVPGRGFRKKLWIAAIDINGTPGKDISHPAFYLEGQEARAGNMRGFWALDPCKADGNTCESGDDCCGGFCRQVDQNGTPVKMCVPPPAACSNESEKCSIDADCCNAPAGTKCVGGFCNQPAPNVPK